MSDLRYYVRLVVCFFFNDTATTEIYTLSLHDALPISRAHLRDAPGQGVDIAVGAIDHGHVAREPVGRHRALARSEEHTSELQSRQYLVCRLLLEKKKIHPHTLILPLYHPCFLVDFAYI